jgi:hypothetical protein
LKSIIKCIARIVLLFNESYALMHFGAAGKSDPAEGQSGVIFRFFPPLARTESEVHAQLKHRARNLIPSPQ